MDFCFEDYLDLANPFQDYSRACVLKYLFASRVSGTDPKAGTQVTFTGLEKGIQWKRASSGFSSTEQWVISDTGIAGPDMSTNSYALGREHEALWNHFVRPVVSHALEKGLYPAEFKRLGLFVDHRAEFGRNLIRLNKIFDYSEDLKFIDNETRRASRLSRKKNIRGWAPLELSGNPTVERDDQRRTFRTENHRILGDFAAAKVPFSTPGNIAFFQTLGFEMLLSITIALDPEKFINHQQFRENFFLETATAIFKSNTQRQPKARMDAPHHEDHSESPASLNRNAAAIEKRPYMVLLKTIHGLMSNKSSLSSRTYPSLFSKAVHSYQANSLDNDLFEPSETRDSQHREKFLSELEQWLDSLASEKDAQTKAKISGGISDFKAYAKKTDARLGAGATGGRIGRRSWRLALNEEAHQRFCMWGGDFARLIAATTVSYCEQQGISESEDWGRHETACMEPTKIRDLGSLPALLLAVPFLGRSKRDEQKICLFLSHEEMSQYLDALGGGNPTHDIGHVIDVGKHVAEDLKFKSRDALFKRLEEMGE